MIHKIILENFYSIADRQELSFVVAKNAPEATCFMPSRSDPSKRIPCIVGFFGANASGKSTILRAVNAAVLFVKHSFLTPVESSVLNFLPYLRKDWWEKPTKLLIEFDGQLGPDQPSYPFRYELHIGNGPKRLADRIVKESLSFAPKREFRKLFSRIDDNFSFGPEFGVTGKDVRINSVRSNASIISTLAQFNHPISVNLLFALNGVQTNLIGSDKMRVEPSSWIKYFAENPEYLNRLNKEIRRLDVGLEKMEIEQSSAGPRAAFKHIGLDIPIYLGEESAGTRKFIELYPHLQYVLDTGGTAIIDELDSDFHPLLIREIFNWFKDKERNPHHAQLLFTAHNPYLLDEMEKEQIFFAEKKSGLPTIIYGARDIQNLRRTPSLLKKYLLGELGAIPHIG
jgi:AAA15 family ATPase/GTPase